MLRPTATPFAAVSAKRRRGMTLIELMVSMTVGLFVLAAAVAVTTDHGRVLGRTTTRLDMHQSGRLAIELLSQDLRHAGIGVGYRPDGSFAGLVRGNFAVAGGATFVGNDRQVDLASGTLMTDDIGIRQASGAMRTIAAFSSASAEICSGSGFAQGDVVVLMSRAGLHARTVTVGPLSPSACSRGTCVSGCESFSFTADNSYVSDAAAPAADYAEGEVTGDYQHVVWFVTPDAQGLGHLQRAEVTAATVCTAADLSCGGTVAQGVESLQMAVWQWDAATSQWVERTNAAQIDSRDRIRVDLELVVRGGRADDLGVANSSIQMELNNQCAPAPCGATDKIRRWATRSSVEIRNSGRMLIR